MSKLRENIFVDTNYFELLLVLSSLQIFKVDNFVLPLILAPKLRSVAQIEWKKHPDIFFLLLVQK